jgi:hypothetical protein
MFAINTGWSKSISLSPHDFQNELLEILPLTSLWHGVKSCTYQFQNVILLYRKWWGILPTLLLALQIYATASRGILSKQGNSKKTCQSIIAKSKPKATNYECGECIIPSVLCWISSSCGVRFFSASLSLIPVVTSFSFNFGWASEDHDFWVFSTLSVYWWASKNLFGKINLACFKPKWKWLRGGH